LVIARTLDLLRRTAKSKFVHNVAVLTTGTVGAQVVNMAFSPVLTRLYGPEAFGLLGTFMAVAAVVAPVAALTYPIAIVLPRTDEDAKGLAWLSLYIALTMAALVALVLLLAGDRLVDRLQVQAIRPFIWLMPLVIVFSAWYQIRQQWLIRKKQFRIAARVAVLQALIVNGVKSGAGLFKPLAAVLIVLYTFGQALHALMLAIGGGKAEPRNRDAEKPSPKTPLRQLAKKHGDFPLYRAPQVFINAVSQSLPVLMLAALFGPASAGFYTICKKVLSMPSHLIGKSVADVFYPRINDAARNGENLTRLILKATLSLGIVGFVPFAVVVAFGPRRVGVVFGEEGAVAGEYARWLAVWMFPAFMNRPSVAAMPVLRLQGFFLIYEIVSVVMRVIALMVGFYLFKNDVTAISLFSLAGLILNASLIVATVLRSRFIRGHPEPSS
jgi:O-antigen/teichoic acid export membrane protein